MEQDAAGQEGTITGRGGVPVYFRKLGRGSRALLIPNAAWLAGDFECLARNRTVVFYDPRGRGNSGPMPDSSQITLEGETEDLDLVLRHCDLERVALFGWSYHAAVAADYASRHPELVERLILSGPMAPSYSGEAARVLQSRLDPQAIADLMKSPPADPATAAKAWRAAVMPGYFADGGAYARGFPQPRESDNERMANVSRHLRALTASLSAWDWRSAAARYGGPVLILHGQGDFVPLEGSREWERSFPNARLLVIPNAGHFIWLEQPEPFFGAMEAFLGS